MKISEVIESIFARQILDSRGNPTVEVEIHTLIGVFISSCPSGASTGSKEAAVILDKTSSYSGKSVLRAVFNIDSIITKKLISCDIRIEDQEAIDRFLCDLDGIENKKRFGANALLPISQSFMKAGAVAKNRSLREHVAVLSGSKMNIPIPHFNVLNGGVHSGNALPIQEIMVCFNHNKFEDNLESGVLFYNELKKLIVTRYGSIYTSVGDEGGFSPPIKSLEEGIDLILETQKSGEFSDMKIALDCAASEFYENEKYDLGNKLYSTDELVEYYVNLIRKYPLIYSIEDPFDENDYEGWKKLMVRIGSKCGIVGDDLTVTNIKMVDIAIKEKLCNTLLVKLNQVGTVIETIQAVNLARSAGMKIMVSHRSGETEDCFIADFSVGLGAEYIKAGAPCRGERVAKYNQLLRIQERMNKE